MHFTICVSMIAFRGSDLRPIARRRSQARSPIMRVDKPRSCQRRNQPYTVRYGGAFGGSARQPPPARRCHAIARISGRMRVHPPLLGGSARSSQAATSHMATSEIICFKRAS